MFNCLDHAFRLQLRRLELLDAIMVQSDPGSRYATMGLCVLGNRAIFIPDVRRS